MSFGQDFKNFISRGNVLDLAVGVAIGAAFGAVITSLVNDVLMPPIGLLLGRVDFTNLFIDLSGQGYPSLAEAQAAGAPTINYGLFINAIINFLLIAFFVFLIVRLIKRVTEREKGAPDPTTKDCPYCQRSIPIAASRCPECTSQLSGAATD
jgi:large conductance mechanosensitive channel